ncbi:ROK family protein [Klugiella xanthotipulae]|uniref:Glucokinase n=1 Tax=Klugiella xanthotipulae TaxID=244735 RepID=A0A543I4I2_9MICO|nr:ROK family protein [Klugiella xanthotipulae]TQM65506.1 glucokinase [Klugiella xanthotipulae]
MTQPWTLAVDLGGTKVDAALVRNGAVNSRSRSRQPTGASATSDQLAASVVAAVTAALAELPVGDTLDSVGVATAGPITIATGSTSPVNLPAWRDFGVRSLVARAVHEVHPGVPVHFGLDGTAITVAEHRYGAGAGIPNLMCIVVSTGIGGGILVDGQLLHGSTGNAGHLGQTYVSGFELPGRPSTAVTFGPRAVTVEEVAAGPGSLAWARQQGWMGDDGLALAADYAAGNAVAIAAVRRSAAAVGQAIAGAAALLNLDAVLVGGGFSRVTPQYTRLVQETVDAHPLPFVRATRVLPSVLGDDGPLLGAAALRHYSGAAAHQL